MSTDGGKCGASPTRVICAVCTLFETGKLNDVDPCAWLARALERCPNHSHVGCSLAGHGTYARETQRSAKIARWYYPESHTTISLLPDCLAARLPGT